MKQFIEHYKIYFFGKEFLTVSQEFGQKIIMAISSSDAPKFISHEDNLINVSAISRMELEQSTEDVEENGKLITKNIYRELTSGELNTQKMFDEFKNKKLLNQ